MKHTLVIFITLSVLIVSEVGAQERTLEKVDADGKNVIEVQETGRAQELVQSDNSAASIFKSIINNPNIPTEVAQRTADFIRHLLSKRKIDTDLLYTYVQTLNSNLNVLGDAAFVKRMRVLTDQLRDSSYTDEIHYNTNLSNQLRTRMPIIVAACAKLSDSTLTATQLAYLKEDFEDELTLFSRKYLRTSRFQAGIGISYTYAPIIEYSSNSRVDLSAFAPSTGGGSSLVVFDQEFNNKSYLNFEIAAKLPWIELGLSIPTYSENATITAPVTSEQLNGSEARSAIYRSTIESKLDVEYDFSVRVPILGNYKRWKYVHANNNQMDYGILAGLTGFNISDTVTTDVKFRTDSTPFADLPAGETLVNSREVSFQTVYLGAYYEFEFVDELYMTVDVKWHNNRSSDGSQIDVDGFTSSLRIIYSPTLDFINF
ncbi:hypothetical protein [Marisediminitalea sp.]|uniref:hypothetical protein n=1 Tax=Marisediminitalea sp. TaxID=2662268 RepID=UPI003511D0F8